MTNELCYLASPYSAPSAKKRAARFRQVCKKAAELMLDGKLIFCPIAHSHPIEVNGMTDRKDGEFWLNQDFAILDKCDKLIVYCMQDWEKSYGVGREIDYANLKGIPIEYISE